VPFAISAIGESEFVVKAVALGYERGTGSNRQLPWEAMKLFTALSADEADQIMRGVLRGDVAWVSDPVRDEAEEDAVWVSIEMADVRLARFETEADPHLGYRKFLIPSRITNLHRAERVRPPS